MGGTWEVISKEVLGYVPVTKSREVEYYVALKKIEQLLNRGWSPRQVAQIWNTSLGGTEVPHAIRGVNKYNVKYDSIAYSDNVMSEYTRLSTR